MLAAQLESGSFVTGLWYFFGIVTAAGIFTGIAGLGVGHTAGLVWEQVHRYRRRSRAPLSQSSDRSMTPTAPFPVSTEQPVLKLVGAATDTLPDLSGRRLNSVRFLESGVELDFVSIRVAIGSAAIISSGIQRMRYPDSGWRDAICALIGARVERLRVISGERIEITFDNGYDLTVPRAAMQVA